MLTLEQIKNVTFTKTMGGYKTNEVDDFIDQCVDTVASLIEERNTSNKKLEVLADKLVEYRNEEDSIRSALVNAQRLGDTIVREANQKAALTQEDAAIKAEKMLNDARTQAEQALTSVSDEVNAQQAELARIKQEVAMFKERMLSIYKEHLTLIDLLPEEVPAAEEPVEETPEEVAEQPIVEEAAPIVEETAPSEEETSAFEAVEMPVAEEPEAVEEKPAQVPLLFEEPQADEPADGAKSRFVDLKFGDDYDIADDPDEGDKKGFFKRKK